MSEIPAIPSTTTDLPTSSVRHGVGRGVGDLEELLDWEGPSRIAARNLLGKISSGVSTDETTIRGVELEAKDMPTYIALRPAPNAIKTYQDKAGMIDLRLAATSSHEDGVAYNSSTDTVVVCDGMGGGYGVVPDAKAFFGFALAHAVAELDDISQLTQETVTGEVITRAKTILEEDLGIKIESNGTRLKGGAGAMKEAAIGSTIAAVQRIDGTNRWRIATLGDSSVVILDREGRIKEGFGEAFQLIAMGIVDEYGRAGDDPMKSYVGLTKDGYEGLVRYGSDSHGAQFSECELHPGEKLVVVSDAYVQKSTLLELEQEVAMTPEEWAGREKIIHDDDTTMAIIGGPSSRVLSRAKRPIGWKEYSEGDLGPDGIVRDKNGNVLRYPHWLA